jgi:hypothetical protein
MSQCPVSFKVISLTAVATRFHLHLDSTVLSAFGSVFISYFSRKEWLQPMSINQISSRVGSWGVTASPKKRCPLLKPSNVDRLKDTKG